MYFHAGKLGGYYAGYKTGAKVTRLINVSLYGNSVDI